MTLATVAALTVLGTVFAAAVHTPKDANGKPVTRSQRTLLGDIVSLVR